MKWMNRGSESENKEAISKKGAGGNAKHYL